MTTDASGRFPTVPRGRLEAGGWVLADESVDALVRLPGLTVRGATLLFRDAVTAAAARKTADVDASWRFFFATALSFEPRPPSAASRTFLLPVVRAKATERFAATLRERGLSAVERVRTDRRRLGGRSRVPVTRFAATLELPVSDRSMPVTGWIASWYDGGFLVSGGAYPERPIATILDLDRGDSPLCGGESLPGGGESPLYRDPATYRRELLDLMGSVA